MYDKRWIKVLFEIIYIVVMLFIVVLALYRNKLDIGHYIVIFLFNIIYAQVIKITETKVKTQLVLNLEIYSLLLFFVMLVYFQDVDSYFAHSMLLLVNILILVNWFSILDGKIYQLYKVFLCVFLCVYIICGYVLIFINENLLNVYLSASVILIMLVPIGYVIKNYKRIINYMDYKKNIIVFLILSWFVSAFLYIKLGLFNYNMALVVFIFISIFQYIIQKLFLTYHLKLNRISNNNIIIFVIIGIIIFIVRLYIVGIIGLILLNLYIFIISNNYFRFKKNDHKYYNFLMEQLKDESLYHKEISNYLHDSILQDVIYLKKSISEENISKEDISKMLNDIILSIRTKMDNLAPMLYSNMNLYENINLNIEQIQKKYIDKSIVIDLFCNKDIYIECPYDEIVIRIIKELVNNIYKHTESNFVEIKFFVEKNKINISVFNDEGFLDQQVLFKNNRFSGLNQIYRTINLLNGDIKVENNNGVLISIFIPIIGGRVIENSINRRP